MFILWMYFLLNVWKLQVSLDTLERTPTTKNMQGLLLNVMYALDRTD